MATRPVHHETAPSASPPQDRFGGLERIGGGPHGDVWRAFDRRLGREVAVKSLHRLDALALFRLGPRLGRLQALFHEHLAPVLDAVTAGPTPFMVREAVAGDPFLDVLRLALEGGQTSRAADLLGQVLRGLEALDHPGLVHGHLVAENVRVDDGRVVLLDAGLRTGERRVDLLAVLELLRTALDQAPPEAAEPWRRVLRHGEDPAGAGDLEADWRRLLADLEQSRHASPLVFDRPFVGREGELRHLERLLGRSRGGEAVVVRLEGGAGVGTSALVSRFLRLAEERWPDALALGAACRRAPGENGALDALLDELTRRLAAWPDREVEVAMPARPRELGRLFPALLRLPSVALAPRPSTASAAERHDRASLALRQLLDRLAERRPVILALDEAERADEASLDLLRRVLEPPDPPALVLLLTVSSGAGRPPALDRLLELPHEVLHLPPLGATESRWMARALLGEHASKTRVEAVAEASEGSPSWIVRLVDDALDHDHDHDHDAYGDAASPDSAATQRAAALGRRLAKLDPDSRRLLEILAAAGRPLEPGLATDAAGIDRSDLEAALDELLAEDVVRRRGPYLVVTDPPVRRAVLDLADNVPALRGRVATTLRGGDAGPEELAHHFAAAGDHAAALETATLGAEDALTDGRVEQALELWHLALELIPTDHPDRWRRHRDLARGLDRAGDYLAAAEHYESASHLAPTSPLTYLRLAADRRLTSGDREGGLARLGPLLERTGLAPLASPGSRLAAAGRGALRVLRRALLPLWRLRGGAQESELLGVDVAWTLCRGWRLLDPGRAGELSREHLLRARRSGDDFRLCRALALETAYQAYGGWRRRQRVERLGRRAISLARRLERPQAQGLAEVMIGEAWVLLGEWRRALAALERGQQILENHSPQAWWERRSALFLQLRCLAMLGQLDEIARRLRQIHECSTLARVPLLHDAIGNRFAWLVELAADRPGDALESLESLEHRRSSFRDAPQTGYWQLYGEIEIAIYRGDVHYAWHHLDEQWRAVLGARLEAIELVRIEAWHLRARAALAALAMRPHGADAPRLITAVEQALDVLEGIASPWSDAVALLVRGGLFSLLGRRLEAGELLQRAESRLDHLDMALCVQACRRQRARLLPSAVTDARLEDIDRRLRGLGVTAPERMADLLVPGAWVESA